MHTLAAALHAQLAASVAVSKAEVACVASVAAMAADSVVVVNVRAQSAASVTNA